MRKISEIVIHISDSSWGDVEAIREWHLARGWNDIGYHNVILNGKRDSNSTYLEYEDGLIEQGRAYDIMGAGVLSHNSNTIHMCLIGKDGVFTPNQLNSMYNKILLLMKGFNINVDGVKGHYEYDTANGKTCPDMDMEVVRFNITRLLTTKIEPNI